MAQANCVGLRLPLVRDSLPPRPAVGPDAQNVGQGQTLTAAPASDRHLLCASPVQGVRAAHCWSAPASGPWLTPSSLDRGAGRPQCRPRANFDGSTYLQPALPSRVTGSRGSGRQQCRLKLVCACLQAVVHSLLAGPRGRAPTECRPRVNCFGLRPPPTRTRDTRGERVSRSGERRLGCAAGLVKFNFTPGRRGHVHLERNNPPDLGWLSRTASVSDMRF